MYECVLIGHNKIKGKGQHPKEFWGSTNFPDIIYTGSICTVTDPKICTRTFHNVQSSQFNITLNAPQCWEEAGVISAAN